MIPLGIRRASGALLAQFRSIHCPQYLETGASEGDVFEGYHDRFELAKAQGTLVRLECVLTESRSWANHDL